MRTLTSLALFVGLINSGCTTKTTTLQTSSPTNKLVGYWEGHENSPVIVNGKEVAPTKERPPLVIELRDDMTFKADMIIAISGTWKLLSHEGSIYKIETTVTADPPEFKDMPKANMPRTRGFTFTLVSDDEAKVAPTDDPRDSITFKRKKK